MNHLSHDFMLKFGLGGFDKMNSGGDDGRNLGVRNPPSVRIPGESSHLGGSEPPFADRKMKEKLGKSKGTNKS